MPAVKKPKRVRNRHFFREWRDIRGLNQEDVAPQLGWSQSKISRLESGKVPYSQDDLEGAADLYGISPGQLLADPGLPEPMIRGDAAILSVLKRIEGLTDDGITIVAGVIRNTIKAGRDAPEHTPSDAQQPTSTRHRG